MNSSIEDHAQPRSGLWRRVLAYALFGGLWAVLYWLLISPRFADPEHSRLAAAVNHGIFVGVTAAMLLALLRRQRRSKPPAPTLDGSAPQSQDLTPRLLQALAESSPDAIFAKDREGRYLIFNREAARVMGTTAAQILGRDDGAIFAPEQAAMIRANDARVMAQDRPETFEEEVDTVDGRVTFLATKGALHDAAGQVVGMFGIARDITERLAEQRRLRDSEQRYRLLFESNPHPMWLFDRETSRFIAVNQAALAHYGYSRDEFLAMTIADIHPDEERPRLALAMMCMTAEADADASPDPQRDGIWLHRCKDGRRIEVEISANDVSLDGRRARLVLAHDVTRRRDLERQRQAADDLMHDVLARVDDGLVALDRDWRYTYLNTQAARMLGRQTPADLLGRHIWTEFPESVGQPFHRAYEQAIATQQAVVFEDHYMPWDRWFENRIHPSPEGLSIYFTDTTLRKRAEEALRLSEQRYRLAAAGGQVWDWDLVSDRVDFPAAFWQQLGCQPPPAQEFAMRLAALLHPDDLPHWHHALREHLTRRVPYDLDFRARHADGDWRSFHTQGQAVWDATGRATYMAGTTFDITERMRAEAALRQSEAYRRSLFDQLSDGVLLIDREHRVIDANPQALAMLGYSRAELLRLTAYDLVPSGEHHRVDAVVREVMTGKAHLAEWDHVGKYGGRFPAEVSARVMDERRFIAVIRDITVRRAAQQTLLSYQLELSELTQRLLAQERITTQRVAQALHDHLGQTLAVARLNLDACISMHAAAMPDTLREQSQRISMLLDQAVGEVRQVLVDLRPPLLEDQGLTAALDNEIGARAIAGGGADVLLEVADDAVGRRWPADVEYGAFMVAREAIANAHLHAHATLIRVLLGGDADSLSLEVIDDGAGIPAPLVRGRPGHLGIVGMRERANATGARFGVDRAPEGGTRVSLRWEARRP